MKIISNNKAIEIINNNNLTVHKELWHYSYNFTKNATYKVIRNSGSISLIQNNIYTHAPALIYTKSNFNELIKSENSTLLNFDSHDKTQRKVFWFLRITTLEDFLERRSKSSNKPKKHFPTTETYLKTKNKINCDLDIVDFDESFFIYHYNKIKRNDYLDASSIVANLKRSYPDLPQSWIKLAYLKKDSNILAIALLVDDGKSISLENIAAERSSLSYGVYVCTEIIKYCSDNKYYSFDAGVSGIYGVYKSKIFIDSFEVFNKHTHTFFSRIKKLFKSL